MENLSILKFLCMFIFAKEFTYFCNISKPKYDKLHYKCLKFHVTLLNLMRVISKHKQTTITFCVKKET